MSFYFTSSYSQFNFYTSHISFYFLNYFYILHKSFTVCEKSQTLFSLIFYACLVNSFIMLCAPAMFTFCTFFYLWTLLVFLSSGFVQNPIHCAILWNCLLFLFSSTREFPLLFTFFIAYFFLGMILFTNINRNSLKLFHC